jgi:hypothetical protein
MVRYLMTIREACDLVITAATHALTSAKHDVSVYVLNMGQPVRIVDLAERMIRLSGLQPGYDVEIVFTGIRPGERLNEILFASEESSTEIGIAGVMALSVSQRTHELGVRLALGASPSRVLSMVIRQGMAYVLIGLSIGVGGALLLGRLMSSLLFAVAPTDPITFLAVSGVLMAVAATACFIPARRVTSIDPMLALRSE